MKNRIISTVLTILIVLALVPTTAAYAANNDSDFIIVDGVLTEYIGPGGDVVIPDGVKEIKLGAFSLEIKKLITSVIRGC